MDVSPRDSSDGSKAYTLQERINFFEVPISSTDETKIVTLNFKLGEFYKKLKDSEALEEFGGETIEGGENFEQFS